MEYITNIVAFLAPFKWLIVGGSTLIGVGCIVLAVRARRKKREED